MQPPSRGCVLKHLTSTEKPAYLLQPPSRGCVLKQNIKIQNFYIGCSRLRAAVC